MNDKDFKVEMMPIESIRPYENNPRFNDDAVEELAKSISTYGFRNPIVVDSDLVIIAGHTRRLAAIRLGLKTVPVHVAKELTKEQANAFRLVDNKTAELSNWNFDALYNEVIDLKEAGYDMSLLAFDMTEIERILEAGGSDDISHDDEINDDAENEEPEKQDFNVTVVCGNMDEQDAAVRILTENGFKCMRK